VNDEQRVRAVSAVPQVQPVRSKRGLFRRIDRTGTCGVRLLIPSLLGCRGGEDRGGRLVSKVDQTDRPVGRHAGRNQPLTSGHEGEIFRSDLIADEPNVAEGIAARNRTSLSSCAQWQRKRNGETDKCQWLHAPSLSTPVGRAWWLLVVLQRATQRTPCDHARHPTNSPTIA